MRATRYLIPLLLPFVVVACATATPTPTPQLPPVVEAPTSVPPPSAPVETATAQLVLTLITPTPFPTNPPPTETVTPTVAPPGASAGTSAGTPVARSTTQPALGTGAADAALVAILQSCWHVTDPRQLNGNKAEDRDAFDCARARLLSLAQDYPNYALVHRVLAWGYYFKDNNVSKSQEEYRTAVTLYQRAGDKVGESEARMRLGLLLVGGNRSLACGELSLAATLDRTNDRALQYYKAYQCTGSAQTVSGTVVAPPPALEVNLDEVRGKILFKTDRDGMESYYVMDPDGKNPKRVTSAVYSVAQELEAWSPDHSKVAVVKDAGYTRKFGYNNDIWVTDPSGQDGRALENPANDYDPAWSPLPLFDGSYWIAFVSNRGDIQHEMVQGEEIWGMHPDSRSSWRLTCFGAQTKHPSWAPDVSQMVFSSNYQTRSPRRQIYVVDLSVMEPSRDKCAVGDTARNLSNNSSDDYDPIWVK